MKAEESLVDDRDALAALVGRWDELAVPVGAPTCAPAWMLGWYERLCPDAECASVALYVDDELVGLAPLVLDRGNGRADVRLMAAGLLQRIAPIVLPGYEHALAAETGRLIGTLRPRPDVVALEGVSVAARWPAMLRAALRAGAPSRQHRTSVQAAPVATLAGHTFDSWMATRSANFRSEMRRARKRLERQNGRVRVVTGEAADFDDVVAALGRLHRGRWTPVGHPGVIDDRVEELIADVARRQAASARLRLMVVELDGAPVSAQVFLAAGGEVNYWNGGWDEEYRDLKPGMLGILAAIEDSIERGERRLDLGGGAQPYKLRFADGDDPIEWAVLTPIRLRYPLTRAEILRQQVRWRARTALQRLPPEHQARIRSILRRG